MIADRFRAVGRTRAAAGSLSRQFGLLIALAVVPVLIALGITTFLMILSGHEAVLVGLIILAVAAAAALVAKLITNGIVRDVRTIGAGLRAVADGDRTVRIDTLAADELAELAGSANAMIAALRAEEAARDQSDDARRALVAAVSHDLRTPITALRLLAEAVGDDVVDGPTRSTYLQGMLIHIHALSTLIDDLFELSRLEAGDISWSLEQVALGELVTETVDAMRIEAEAKGVSVQALVASGLRPAHGNPEKLQRVLFNLIQNAIRHTPADGSVAIRAEPVAAGIEVEVADNGSGIAPQERERVFEAFRRGGDEGARTSEGAGLGLAVARAIVEAHGGRIWVAESSQGTRVRFSLQVA